MAVVVQKGVKKGCSICRKWGPLSEFPQDRTHGESQGGRHCRCKSCHGAKRKEHRLPKR